MKKMGNQIDRLHYLIKDLLDVTKIREGQLQLQTVEFDFDKLLEEVVEDMQSTTRQHIIVNKAKTDQHIFADPNKIREVLINLISNAIKYSPGTGRIEIHAHTREKELVVSVKDFGIGIAQHNLPKLFNRFMRVNDSTINTFPGLGLGLFISAEIIKKHNGTIWAESEEGKGSEFIFTIPLKKP